MGQGIGEHVRYARCVSSNMHSAVLAKKTDGGLRRGIFALGAHLNASRLVVVLTVVAQLLATLGANERRSATKVRLGTQLRTAVVMDQVYF